MPSVSSIRRTDTFNDAGARVTVDSVKARTYAATCSRNPSRTHITACGFRHNSRHSSRSRSVGSASGKAGTAPR